MCVITVYDHGHDIIGEPIRWLATIYASPIGQSTACQITTKTLLFTGNILYIGQMMCLSTRLSTSGHIYLFTDLLTY